MLLGKASLWAVPRVDSHQHFWEYSAKEYGWIGENMSVLKRDFMPSDLKPLLNKKGVRYCVAVQARRKVEETEWLLDLAKKHNFIAGVVGWVDFKSPDLKKQLDRFAKEEKVLGFREALQAFDPEFMLEDQFVEGLKQLLPYNYSYDLLVKARHLKATKQLVEKLSPKQRLVIDHIAKPSIAKGEIDEWANDMKAIAQHSNVYCKLSGMVTEAGDGWSAETLKAYMDVVFEAFGEDRIMYGSDWPVCLLQAEYPEVHKVAYDYVAKRGKDCVEKVFGKNAERFYKLKLADK